MSYCHIHGRYDDYFDRGCPACQIAEQDLRQAEWELRNAVSEAAYAKANPGDHECPHCLYRSLKKGASRCPLCHGEVRSAYWDVVRALENAAAERDAAEAKAAAERRAAMEAAAEAELLRTAPERAAAARAAARAAASAAAEQATILGVKRFFACVAGVLVGGIVGFLVSMIIGIPLVFICFLLGNEGAANTILTGIIVIAAIFGGVVGVILVEK